MNEVIMLHGAKPLEILGTAVDRKIPLAMSYLSRHKWQVARAILTDLKPDSFDIKITPQKKTRPVSIQFGQSVGMSLKYGYGVEYDKFVFGTTVVAIKSSSNPAGDERIVLAIPEEIEMVRKESYLPVEVPESLQVDVRLWHRDSTKMQTLPQCFWRGRLIDICADSVRIMITPAQKPQFQKGQSLGLRFVPLPHETAIMFNAQVKDITLSADGTGFYLGLQMIGLEATVEGRLVMQRLCSIVDQYHQAAFSEPRKQQYQPLNF